jgi:conjugative transfer signal peptidase TraF
MRSAVVPLLGVGAAIVFVAAAMPEHRPRVLWNASASLPVGLYLLSAPERPSVGDLVAVRLPPEHAAWAAERGYLGRSALLLKRIAALPGTEVCRLGSVIRIDGTTVATALKTDTHDRPMPVWQGCVLLAESEVFLLLAETPGSLDGRYFGPTEAASIVARARPIWTMGG